MIPCELCVLRVPSPPRDLSELRLPQTLSESLLDITNPIQTPSGTLTCETHANVAEQVGVLGATLAWIQANVAWGTH